MTNMETLMFRLAQARNFIFNNEAKAKAVWLTVQGEL